MPSLAVAAASYLAFGTTALAEIGVTVGAWEISAATIATALDVAAAVYTVRDQQRREQNRARDAYNAGLRARYVMIRSTTEPRALVLGRQRVSGPIIFIQSYGAYNAALTFVVVLAAHEIDAVEKLYFDDHELIMSGQDVVGIVQYEDFSITGATASVTLEGTPASGTVSAVAIYGSTIVNLTVDSVTGTPAAVDVSGGTAGAVGMLRISYQPNPCPYVPANLTSTVETFATTSTPQTFTLAATPVASSVIATQTSGYPQGGGTQTVATVDSVTGTSVTLSNLTVGTDVAISYQSAATASKARIRAYLGAPGQTADADLIAHLPNAWTAAHVGNGLAYLVIELDYDQDAFPSGIPNVSATVRGLKCLDPRTGSTAWTENPALLLRGYATHELGGRMSELQIDDASLSAAASICDQATEYSVGGQTYSRALYTAGLVAKTAQRPLDVFQDIAQAMGGRWWFADGMLRCKAGAYSAPVMALDETWLHGGSAVQVQPQRNRADIVNAITGSYADEEQDYKVVALPRFAEADYVESDGAVLGNDVQFASITFSGQAQYVAACQIRRARAGMTIKASCNMRAYPCEPGDVVTVTLPRFGFGAKAFEVMEANFGLDGGIDLTLQETDPGIWALDADYVGREITTSTFLPSPWVIQEVAGLSATSGAATLIQLADGTVQPRILVTWTAATDPSVVNGGGVEVAWGLPSDDPETWSRARVTDNSGQLYVADVRAGITYAIKARAFNGLVYSPWCTQISHKVQGNTSAASAVSSFAGTKNKGRIVWTWAACTDADYWRTELRSADSNWGNLSSAPLWSGVGTSWTENITVAATYTVYARHINTSGVASSSSASASVTMTSGDL